MPKLSKRLASLVTKVEERAYAPLEAIQLVKDNANAKFDETMEAHVRLGIDPKYTISSSAPPWHCLTALVRPCALR